MIRRDVLRLGGMLATGLPLSACIGPVKSTDAHRTELNIQTAAFDITNQTTEKMVSTSPDSPPPVLRLKQHRPFEAVVHNMLKDYTAMHWHGIRLPNTMDGVPYLTQIPLGQGDSYTYHFTPYDAGTYWYHPHCMTMNQMARGLTGVIIVEEHDAPIFDADITVNLRDFRIGSDSQFIELYTPSGAARAGTLGTVLTANWRQIFTEIAPAGGLIRLRLVATDTTRIYKILFSQTNSMPVKGRIIAMDGHPVTVDVPWPTEQDPLLLAPGQRADIALLLPREAEQNIDISTLVARQPKKLCSIQTQGPDLQRSTFDIPNLTHNPVSEPDLSNAETLEFVFGWSPDGSAPNNGFCGSLDGYTFWSINRTAWAGDAANSGPLADLKLGGSYILRLRNESPNMHPVHLHGLVFRPLQSNKRVVLPNWTDTALLLKDEMMDVALVADNPGDWAFHCHVIEHQKTGLAGYLRIS